MTSTAAEETVRRGRPGYDREQGRVIYPPVTFEPRENTPRIIREDSYAGEPGFRKG